MENSKLENVQFFIDKFSKIEDKFWNVGSQKSGDTYCALGHCVGGFGSCEQTKLASVFSYSTINIIEKHSCNHYKIGDECNGKDDPYIQMSIVAAINNGETAEYRQATPKARILAALYDIKAKLQPKEEVKERIVYVTVDKEVRELQKVEELIEN